ncbi:hypothetical protein [Arthrobacter sp. 9V]|uniref:hypothetical protein n=1 Tax=Arthrobacter sp. 9V TaxID=2653132 RepID=UPI0013589874|nr:hypothetical protein [Arthrobacter sp. 9V]
MEYKDGKVTQFPDFFPGSDSGSMLAYDPETRTMLFGNRFWGSESGVEITAAKDGRFQSLGKFTLNGIGIAVDPIHDKVLVSESGKVILMDSKWPDPKAPQGRDADGFADVLARDGAGNLWMHPGNGKGGMLPQVRVGSSWNAMSPIL